MSLGSWFALVGAVAAVVAAVYAVKAFLASQSASQTADARRRHDVRPRVTLNLDESARPRGRVVASNAGGAVVQGYVLAQGRGEMVGARFTLAGHASDHAFGLGYLGDGKGGGMTFMSAIGQDTDGDWWDLLTNEQLETAPPGWGVDSDVFRAWMVGRSGGL